MNIKRMERRSFKQNMVKIIFLDLETTGFNPFTSHIIEIAMCDNKGHSWETLIKSPNKLSSKIVEITKITDSMLEKDGIDIKSALTKMAEFISDAKWIVGHNIISFDWAFIYYHCKINGIKLPKSISIIDTYRMAQYCYNENQYQSYKLMDLCRCFKIEQDGFHRAMNDVNATYNLYMKLVEIFISKYGNASPMYIWENTTKPFIE
jgi:DNA polymerase III alpha subunit (gram-positive type)